MTSNWQRCFAHETIPENNSVTPSFLCTPHCLPFASLHSHLPDSALSTLLIFHTPHLRALLTFYTQQIVHSALHVFHRNLFWLKFSPFNSLFCSQIEHRKQRRAFLQDLLEVFLELTPNTTSVKDYYFGPKARSGACTAAG